jgi:hypothetical protein
VCARGGSGFAAASGALVVAALPALGEGQLLGRVLARAMSFGEPLGPGGVE